MFYLQDIFLNDFYEQSIYLFKTPAVFDLEAIKPKWSDEKTAFFNEWKIALNDLPEWTHDSIEVSFKNLAAAKNSKAGELQLPFRIMLVGAKYGLGVFLRGRFSEAVSDARGR